MFHPKNWVDHSKSFYSVSKASLYVTKHTQWPEAEAMRPVLQNAEVSCA